MTVRDITYVGEGLIPAPLNGPALRYAPLLAGDVTDVAIHHMTGWNPPPDATADQEIRFLLGIDAYHRGGRGLDGIGYQLVAMASGRVYVTARLDRYAGGVGGHNNHVPSIALPGDYTTQPPAVQHQEATVVAVRFVFDYLSRDVPTQPHRKWGGTTCPGDVWEQWVPGLRDRAKEDEMTAEDRKTLDALKAWQQAHAVIVRDAATSAAFLLQDGQHRYIPTAVWQASGLADAAVVEVSHDSIMKRAPQRGADVTLAEAALLATT